MSAEVSQLLKNLWDYRKQSASISLRAFAAELNISPSLLSEILNRKRNATPKIIKRILTVLNSKDKTERKIRDRLILCMSTTYDRKNLIKKSYHQLDLKDYAEISDWHDYALVNLVETADFVDDPKWIAERLGIDVSRVKHAITKLSDLGLLHIKDGKLCTKTNDVEVPTDINSADLRKMQNQNLDLAKKCLNEVPLELRDITSVYMPVDLGRLRLAKRLITDFRRKMDQIMTGGNQTEVYSLNIQLIPLTKLREVRCEA